MPTKSNRRRAEQPAQTQTIHHKLITSFFEEIAPEWKAIYERRDVCSVIHQYRHSEVLALVEKCGIAPGSAVLDVGAGAGLMTVALAKRGYRVHATDCAKAMTDLTRRAILAAGVDDRVTQSLADVNCLPLRSSQFQLVVALGVIPWLDCAESAVKEMCRVLQPGGYVIVNADNRWRINLLLDPLSRLGMMAGGALRRLKIRRPIAFARFHSPWEFDSCLVHAGFRKVEGKTLGFGPFTWLRKPLVGKSLGIKINDRLQRSSDRGTPVLRLLGAQYLVLASKPRMEERV